MIITFDIETIPTNNDDVINDLRKSIKPPAQYKKKESIDQWLNDNAENELKKSLSKTSLNGMHGRVACIAFAKDDEDVLSTEKEMTEEDVIQDFYDHIKFLENKIITFCGHNIAGFDLPFLKHRSMILGIKPPDCLLNAMKSKPWDGYIIDTMLMWSTDKDKRVSLDNLCKALGIEGKGDMNGSMVADTWLEDPQKVIDYCKDDVLKTREVYKHLSFQNAGNF